MPWLDLQVKTLLISTSLIPAFTILLAILSVIASFLSTITSLVSGLITFLAVYLPMILSDRLSITEPSLSSIKSLTNNPLLHPQSSSLIIISWATSTSLLVK